VRATRAAPPPPPTLPAPRPAAPRRAAQAAIDAFNLALELPGNGAYRLPGSPREYLCPSDAEENAALYNLACCYSAMGQRDAALTCIEAVLDNGGGGRGAGAGMAGMAGQDRRRWEPRECPPRRQHSAAAGAYLPPQDTPAGPRPRAQGLTT
jgi:hypothetical protein